jgi:outer membrane biosynthesis protein TonB
MKALTITFAIILSVFNLSASNTDVYNKGRKPKDKAQEMKASVDQQINKHIFYPTQGNEKNLEGKADVMLQVLPQGDVQVVLIQSGNPLVKKFIEKQVRKMKIDKNEVVAGEIFKYRFVFRAKE